MKKMKNEVQQNMHQCVLADGEHAEIIFSGGTVKIDSNGEAVVSDGTIEVSGSLFDSFSNDQNASLAGHYNGSLDTRYDPTKADKIQQYLHMLFQSNQSGHKVNDEIGEALKEYKTELGI